MSLTHRDHSNAASKALFVVVFTVKYETSYITNL